MAGTGPIVLLVRPTLDDFLAKNEVLGYHPKSNLRGECGDITGLGCWTRAAASLH